MRFVRWKAMLPLALVLAVIVGVPMLFADRVVRSGVERTGTHVVGARVDVREADVAIGDGRVALLGLAVTNPGRPMTNLLEAEEVRVDLRVLPLLERKVVLDTVAVRGLRFNTPRRTSGAIGEPSSTALAARRSVTEWTNGVRVPPLDLTTLTRSVNVDAIDADSLATLREARHALAYVDTARARLAADLQALDPRPTIDSAEALAARLRGADVRTLGIGGARQAVADVRRTLTALAQLDDRLRAFEQDTRENAGGLTQRLAAIPAARAQDYAYARSLLQLPSFDVPALGPQLFSEVVAAQVAEVLYWAQWAEGYMPPGLRRQLRAGPGRVRASGTDVLFPREEQLPDFLIRLAELSLSIGGEGAAAGAYDARLTGVTTQPAILGAPTTFRMARRAGRAGPTDARVAGMLDHRHAPVRDTVAARFSGIALPTIPVGGLGAQVMLGVGATELRLDRRGETIDGSWTWRAPNVTWERDTAAPRAATPALRLVEDALWRAVSRLDSVEIEARFSGSLRTPTLGIRTNVAAAVGNALRDQLGDEIRRAEQQVRAKVDALVEERVAEARAQADHVKAEVTDRIAGERARLEAQKVALEARLRDLVRIPGIG
jgi:uncharacterized protein (TIGR03545 family)